jgi:hypothetical protein
MSIPLAVVITLIHGSTFWNRLTIQQHKASYREETFLVTDASFTGDEGTYYSLAGTIKGREERMQPFFPRGSEPRNRTDLLRAYPVGTKIDVIYNPDVPDIVFNGESARVIQAGLSYLDEEPRRFRSAALETFLPIPLALVFFFTVRNYGKKKRLAA